MMCACTCVKKRRVQNSKWIAGTLQVGDWSMVNIITQYPKCQGWSLYVMWIERRGFWVQVPVRFTANNGLCLCVGSIWLDNDIQDETSGLVNDNIRSVK